MTRDYQILNSGSSLKTIGSDVVITAARGVPVGLRSPEGLDEVLWIDLEEGGGDVWCAWPG